MRKLTESLEALKGGYAFAGATAATGTHTAVAAAAVATAAVPAVSATLQPHAPSGAEGDGGAAFPFSPLQVGCPRTGALCVLVMLVMFFCLCSLLYCFTALAKSA